MIQYRKLDGLWSFFDRAAEMPASRLSGVETELHRTMKRMVRSELELDNYLVVEEPLFPPTRRISWSSYRPDLLGVRAGPRTEEIAIVECETHPSMRRLECKNYSSLWFEPSVLREGSIRRILAVPRGTLHILDMRLREKWEIWVLGSSRPFERISCLTVNSA